MSAPSLLWQSVDRLNVLSEAGIGVSRHRAKKKNPGMPLAGTSGAIHSTSTKDAYTRVVRGYVAWARPQGYRHLWQLDRDREALARGYLGHMLASDPPRSPWTLAQARSAIRMFHGDRSLGEGVPLPRRSRQGIVNNRGSDLTRGRINLTTHADLVRFLECSGLRRREVEALRVKHILVDRGTVRINVPRGKGGRPRLVDPLGDHGWIVDLVRDRHRNDLVFARIPCKLRVHVLRRRFAQAYYLRHSSLPLPDPQGRLSPGSWDRDAALLTAAQLGHGRVDVVLTSYLR